jgi:hypothetical protein
VSNTLIFGGDESNHHELNDYPEVCVHVCSSVLSDREVYTYGPRRNYNLVIEYLKDPRRDYRFVLINRREINPPRHNNLPVVNKSLVLPFIGLYKPDRIEIYLDGVIMREDKDLIKKNLPKLEVYIEGFVKHFKQSLNPPNRRIKDKINSKQFKQPLIVKIADEISHNLFKLPLEELASHPKRVPFLK